MYIHLHLHTHYSLLAALKEPKTYITKAKKLEMSALAITDYNGMFGAIEHYKYCKKSDIKPIIGVELWFTQDISFKNPAEQVGTIVLLAKNHQGYLDLLKISSQANLKGRNNKARVDITTLNPYGTNCFVLIGGKQSRLAQMIIRNESKEIYTKILESLIAIFGSNHIILETIVWDEQKDPDIHRINTHFIALAKEYDTHLSCSPNPHVCDQSDIASYEIFLCIKENKRVFDADKPKVTQPLWMMSEEEIYSSMIKNGYDQSLVQSMIDTTAAIATQIDIQIPLGKALFPTYHTPPAIHELYTKFQSLHA
jgi:DNA polymerase III subunit alpha